MLLIPLLALHAPRGSRLKTLVASCALPGTFVVLVLVTNGRTAFDALFSPVNMGNNTPGHLAFYATWLGAETSRLSRALGVAISPLVAWRVRKVSSPAQLLAAASLMVLLRPFSEAINYSYYWSPALILAGLTGLAVSGRIRIRDWVWPVLAIAWSFPIGNHHTTGTWWAVELILLSATYVQVLANCGFGPLGLRISRRSSDPVKDPAMLDAEGVSG